MKIPVSVVDDERVDRYTAKRRLEAMEFQLEDLEGLVDILYRGA